ncbi:hypothetical protein Tco_0218680 [Tanacetum coccineum]
MPANVTTYDGTGNDRGTGQQQPRKALMVFGRVAEAFRLNFTQRRSVPEPCERASKTAPGIHSSNMEPYIGRMHTRQGVPQTLMIEETYKAFIQGKPPPRTAGKADSNNRSQEHSRRQSNDQSSSRNNSYRSQRGGRGNDKYTPLTMTPKEILATEGSNFPKPPPNAHSEEQRAGMDMQYHRQKVILPIMCPNCASLIDNWSRRADWITWWKNIKEGKINKGGGKKDAPRTRLTHLRLRPEVKSQLNPATTSLTGFTGEKIWPMGQLRLPVIVGNKEHSTTAWMNFMVIRSPSPYNGIIGRPGISAIRAVPSTAHGMLKFPVDGGIVTIYNTAAPPKECNTVTGDVTQTNRQHATKVTNLKVAIHPDYPEQEVSIGGSLSDTGRAAVCALLQRNLDIFAWEPKHMTGVPRSITEHKLKIRPGYSPVRQKKRGQAPERTKAILEEVHKINLWRQVSCEKSITMTGSPTQLWSKRAMVAGGCAWTSPTSTKHVHKTAIHYPR